MSLGSLETRRVRPRYDSDIDDADGLDSASEHDTNSSDISDGTHSEETENEDDSAEDNSDNKSSEDENEGDELGEISFGALAKAQASFYPLTRKRKRSELSHDDEADQAQPATERWEWSGTTDRPRQDLSRSSKHAPAMMSTRNPVSRKRAVFSPPASEKSRDPRFEAPIVADAARNNPNASKSANKRYAFLSAYQAGEVLELKGQIKRTKDVAEQSRLKRQLMSLEAKLRNAQTQQREAEILREHRQKEKAAIREGRKARPFYLKPSDVRKRITAERESGLSKGAKEKAERRKRKREKAKDSKDMPWSRRNG